MWADEPLTTRDLEKILGVQRETISSAMSRYQKIHKRNGNTIKLPYIERLRAKAPDGAYRYKITKKGIEAYVSYLGRISSGISLRRVGKKERMETYGKYPQLKLNKRSGYDLLPHNYCRIMSSQQRVRSLMKSTGSIRKHIYPSWKTV